MKALWVLLGVLGLIVLVALFAGGSYVSAKNQMVQKSADVDSSFSNIDVDLQRRADLIPNLVATVKGYAKVEETVLTNIANARSGLLTAQTPNEKLAEDELAGSENRIAVARTRYNATIKDYNVFIEQFPNSIWANFAGFHPKNEYYKADDASRTAPKVDFSK
jgi:LemA protein